VLLTRHIVELRCNVTREQEKTMQQEQQALVFG
jgi:hypothetical protein